MASIDQVIAARAQVKAKDGLRARLFAELFAQNDPAVTKDALRIVDLWQTNRLCSQIYIGTWRQALHGDQSAIDVIMAADGAAYRQNHPFASIGADKFKLPGEALPDCLDASGAQRLPPGP